MRLVLVFELLLIEAACEVLLIGLVLSVVFWGAQMWGGPKWGSSNLWVGVDLGVWRVGNIDESNRLSGQ